MSRMPVANEVNHVIDQEKCIEKNAFFNNFFVL